MDTKAPGENLVATFKRNQTDIEQKMAVRRQFLEWCHHALAQASSTVPPDQAAERTLVN